MWDRSRSRQAHSGRSENNPYKVDECVDFWRPGRTKAGPSAGVNDVLNTERQDGNGKNEAASHAEIFHGVMEVQVRVR